MDENQSDIEIVPDEESDAVNSLDPAVRIQKLKDDLKKSRDERGDYLAGWQRAKADLINYKKDEGKRLEEFARFATGDLIGDITQVLDSFDLALKHAMPKDVEQGIILIRSQLEDTLKRRGLEIISALGQPFDPSRHESVGEAESDGPEGMVSEELQKGYSLNGKVIRPARVKITKKQ